VTELAQYLFEGLSTGCVFALVALGFTIVYRASGVINFAQGAFVLVGAYLISYLAAYRGVPFLASVLIAGALVAAGGAAFQFGVLRRVRTDDVFTVVMITIGLSILLTAGISSIFGDNQRLLGDPWGSSATHVGGVVLTWVKVWAIATAVVVLLAFFAFDRRSRYGLGMRATGADIEAAAAAGVPVGRVHATAWAIAGLVATVGGLFLAGFPNAPNTTLGDVGLRAFPAIVLGGLGSPTGAVVGGVVIGITQTLTAGYAPDWLGANFYAVAPYVVMIAVLLVKPYGLFGAAPRERL
jgi:branched-chain amino acid transport system permease protein